MPTSNDFPDSPWFSLVRWSSTNIRTTSRSVNSAWKVVSFHHQQNHRSSLKKWKWKMSQIMMNLFLSVAHNRWPDIYVARTRRGRSLFCYPALSFWSRTLFNCFFFKVSNYLLTLQVPLVVDEGIELPQVINTKHNLCYRIWANTFCVMWSTAGQWS